MSFQEAVQACFQRYATFTGRASRSEFWWFALFTLLGQFVTGALDGLLFGSASIFNTLFSLAVLLPGLAVGARRLHDTGRTGWWLLLMLIPVLGTLVLIYFWIQRSEARQNDHGPVPREARTTGGMAV